MRGWLAEAGDAVVSVFSPTGCRICDECLASFAAIPEKSCQVCGQAPGWLTPRDGEPLLCPACRHKTYAFERARSYGAYDRPLVEAILLLKWERIEPLGKWFAERLAEVARREGEALAADIVVPVPLHKDRKRQRGYNQAGLISKPLARTLGLPHKAVLPMRTRPRPNKQILSLEERSESVRGAFATCPGSQVDNKRVLLVDDVLTTGATLDACARALLDSGANQCLD